MAPYSSTLAWKIPWMEEPGRLQSMGSLRVRHDWVTSLSIFTFMLWRRKWQPTPMFLPGESQGRGILVGCCLWGRTESDTTEVTQQQHIHPWGRKESDTTEWLHLTFHFHALEKEMATHSCSCLENPRNGGDWWAAVYEVAQSRTWLKWLSIFIPPYS